MLCQPNCHICTHDTKPQYHSLITQNTSAILPIKWTLKTLSEDFTDPSLNRSSPSFLSTLLRSLSPSFPLSLLPSIRPSLYLFIHPSAHPSIRDFDSNSCFFLRATLALSCPVHHALSMASFLKTYFAMKPRALRGGRCHCVQNIN